jgi:outer membrane protein assembly factor BamB
MHRMLSSVAISRGLVIAADLGGVMHCFDAKTGQRHWGHDTLSAILSSPLIVDDKVYVGNDYGDMLIYRLTAEAHLPLAAISIDDGIFSSPAYSDGTLYVASQHKLLAITGDKEAEAKVPAVAGHWPQSRGPNRDNVSADTGLLNEWPKEGPPLLWQIKGLGDGISPVSIRGGRIFALSQYDEIEYVRAINERTGEHLWTSVLGPSIRQNPLMRWYTQRPPTVDGDRLYAMSLQGELACLQNADGRELWRKHYTTDFAGQRSIFGFADCPIVDGDKLICTPGGPDAAVIALDKKTGNVIWKCAVPDAGKVLYSNGVVVTLDGQRQFVTFLEKTIVGVSVDDGKLLWRFNGMFDSAHTPLIRDQTVLCVNTYGTGLKALELSRENGVFVVKEGLSLKKSFLAQRQDETVILGDRLYETNNGVFSCFNWKTFEMIWQKRMGLTIAITFADGHFYFHRADGQMQLVAPGLEEPTGKSEFLLPGHTNANGLTTPIVTGGRLYVREDDQLFCYDVRAQSPPSVRTAGPIVTLEKPPAKLLEEHQQRTLRSVYVPTPHDIVEKMLELAAVKQTDVVFDLGSGDGRILTKAAKKYGVRAVGYELDKDLATLSLQNAKTIGVEQQITIENKDLFTADLTGADVLAVFLLPQQMELLLPQLEKMKPGSRLVSHQFEIPGVAPDKTVHIISSEDGQSHAIHLWTLPLPKLVRRIEWPGNHVYHTAFSPDGNLYLGGGDTGTSRVWEVSSGKQIVEVPVTIGLFTADNKQILGHNFGPTISVFDIASGQQLKTWDLSQAVVSFAIAPNGQQVVISHADNVLRLWDVASGKEVRKFEGHTLTANTVFSADGKQILSASLDKTIRLWDVATGKLLQTFSDFQTAVPNPGHDLEIKAFFLPDGKIAGTCWSQEKTLLVWNVTKGDVLRKLDLGADFHKDFAVSPDGSRFITGHEDHTVRLYDMTTGVELRRFVMNGVFVPRALNFSPDGSLILAGSHRGWVYLWQLPKKSSP